MLQIEKTQDGTGMTVSITERLDTISAPDFDNEVNKKLDGVQDLTIDVAELEYISSAGLRVLLTAAKAMAAKGGTCIIVNVPQSISDIFEMTGFDQILDIR